MQSIYSIETYVYGTSKNVVSKKKKLNIKITLFNLISQ